MRNTLLVQVSIAALTVTPSLSLRAQSKPSEPVSTTSPSVPVALLTTCKGQVLDSIGRVPIEYANILLRRSATLLIVASTYTSSDGSFTLPNIPKGEYDLIISYIAHKTYKRILKVEGLEYNLSTILLTPAGRTLKEVKIVAERDIIETRPDRIIYNADKDVTITGGTAADLLRNVPFLSLDAEGNLEMRGSRNIRVLINNKPSALIAGSIADALKQLPADQIKSVEVITSPSSRYDGEGTSGIVNINLKRGELQGVSGNTTTGLGNRGANASASLALRRGEISSNTSLGTTFNWVPARSSLQRIDELATTGIGQLTQQSQQLRQSHSIVGRTGLDWDINKMHSISFGAAISRGVNRNNNNLHNRYDAANAPRLDTLFTRRINQSTQPESFDLFGGYTRTFNQSGKEWSILAQLIKNTSEQNYTLEQFPGWEITEYIPDYKEDSRNKNTTLETTLQSDFNLPIRKTKLEAGAKSINRSVQSAYDFYSGFRENELQFNPSRSNSFAYTQGVHSAYVSYTFGNNKKWSYRLGARAEHTLINGSFQQSGLSQFTQRYTNLLPSLMVNYTVGKASNWLRFTYNRRIFRPQIQLLNPFVNRADPRNLYFGNPNLRPEFADAIDLTWNSAYAKGSINASIFGRQSTNVVELVRSVNNEGVSSATYLNAGYSGSYGVNIYASFRPITNIMLSSNASIYRILLTSQALQIRTSQTRFTLNVNSSLKLANNFSLQGSAGYNSARQQLQIRTSGNSFYTLGIRKNWMNDRFSLTLNATNFVHSRQSIRTTIFSDLFYQSGEYISYIRSVKLSASYRFGKIDNKSQRVKQSIRNDDTKQTED